MRDSEIREVRHGDRQQDGGSERARDPTRSHRDRQKAEERYRCRERERDRQ